MCGIAGVRKYGDTPITGEEIVILLCALEHRGNHATGVALVNPDGIHVLKAASPALFFTKSDDFRIFLTTHLTPETSIALLHTRWATTGPPSENENNQPIFDGETAIVHNGMISNHNVLFNINKLQKSCETDSDIIRALVHTHGINEKGIRELCKMNGSAAIACVSTKFPGMLLLARSGSPIVYGFSENGDKLYWASEAKALLTAAKPFHEIRGCWVQDVRSRISVGSMPDNTAWIFNDQGRISHHPFTTCYSYRAPDYAKLHENYNIRQRGWKREERLKKRRKKEQPIVEVVEINRVRGFNDPVPNSVVTCGACGVANRNIHGKPWKELICCKCEAPLES